MGVVATIDYNRFPKQGENKGKRAEVSFNYNRSISLYGVIVRDDMEKPYETLIWLDDGRIIRAVECQYHPLLD